jgi:hypothetical protein
MIVIPGGPPDPAEEECLGLLANVVSNLDQAVSASSIPDSRDMTAVRRLGVVIHRLGGTIVNDIDRRWMRALGLVSVALGIEVMGVVARTRAGTIVRVPESAAAA